MQHNHVNLVTKPRQPFNKTTSTLQHNHVNPVTKPHQPHKIMPIYNITQWALQQSQLFSLGLSWTLKLVTTQPPIHQELFRCVSISISANFTDKQTNKQTNRQTLSFVCLCMTVYEYVWLCMTMYAYVWLCMPRYDYVWLCMTMFDYVWLCGRQPLMEDNL